MRCELIQMDRMAVDERFGAHAGETIRLMKDIVCRRRREQKREEQLDEPVSDQSGD